MWYYMWTFDEKSMRNDSNEYDNRIDTCLCWWAFISENEYNEDIRHDIRHDIRQDIMHDIRHDMCMTIDGQLNHHEYTIKYILSCVYPSSITPIMYILSCITPSCV